MVFEAECKETVIGESVYVIGDISELGNWDLAQATALITSPREFPLWRSRLFHLKSVIAGEVIHFKLVIKNHNNNTHRWESCENRIFRCPSQGQVATIRASFGPNKQVSVSTSTQVPPSTTSANQLTKHYPAPHLTHTQRVFFSYTPAQVAQSLTVLSHSTNFVDKLLASHSRKQ